MKPLSINTNSAGAIPGCSGVPPVDGRSLFCNKSVKTHPPDKTLPLPGIAVFLTPLFVNKPNPKAGVAHFKTIPVAERYRLLVDEKLLKTENGATSFENREPGCLKGGAAMYRHITDTVIHANDPKSFLDKNYLKQLHGCLYSSIRLPCSSSGNTKKLESCGQFRKKRAFFRVKNHYTLKGLLEAEQYYKHISEPQHKIFHVAEYNSSSSLASKVVRQIRPSASKLEDYLKDDKYTVDFSPVKHERIDAVMDELLSGFQQKLAQDVDEPTLFLLLSELASKMDQIHPFQDGNIRVIRGLIDSLLMFYGYCPIFWYDPNIIDLYDSNEIARIMASSIDRTNRVIQHMQSGTTLCGTYQSTKEDKQLSINAFTPQIETLEPPVEKKRKKAF